jgi:transketolase
VATRFIGYGWNVTRVADANDLEMLARAFETFKKTTDRPTLIIVDSHIGYGSPHKQDTNAAHGEPLGRRRSAAGRKSSTAGPRMPSFWCRKASASTSRMDRKARARCGAVVEDFAEYSKKYPELAERLHRMQRRELARAAGIRTCRIFRRTRKGVATRESSGKVLNALAQNIPWLIGGSADLATSNKTNLKARAIFSRQLRRTQSAFRRARACHGRERERAWSCPESGPSVRLSLTSAITCAPAYGWRR